jgi:hypothetical protein
MALDIHTLMQDADHNDVRPGHTIEQHMRANGIPAIASANVVASPAHFRVCRNSVDGRVDKADVGVSLSVTLTLDRVVPNLFDVGLRTRRKDEAHAGWLPPSPTFALRSNKGLEVKRSGRSAGFTLI